MDAYTLLRRMKFNRKLTESVKRAVRMRLEAILEERIRQYEFWKENVMPKQNPTRQKEVRRKMEKIITSYRITIYDLTPFFERTDEPNLINRKR